MASLAREYSQAVRKQTQWWGTFPLDLPLAVGDIIQIGSDGGMIKVANVADRPNWSQQVPIDSTELSSSNQWSWHATTTLAGSATAGVSSTAGAAVNASLTIAFSRVGGFLLAYTGGKHHRFRDADIARSWVLAAARKGEWDRRYVLVTEIMEASCASILVSSEERSEFSLKATAALPTDIVGINIANPAFGFSGSTTEGSVHQSLNARAFPLYHCVRIKKTFWSQYANLEAAGAGRNASQHFEDRPFDDEDENTDDQV